MSLHSTWFASSLVVFGWAVYLHLGKNTVFALLVSTVHGWNPAFIPSNSPPPLESIASKHNLTNTTSFVLILTEEVDNDDEEENGEGLGGSQTELEKYNIPVVATSATAESTRVADIDVQSTTGASAKSAQAADKTLHVLDATTSAESATSTNKTRDVLNATSAESTMAFLLEITEHGYPFMNFAPKA